MTQRMLLRDASPASTSAGATALSPVQPDSSCFEDKIMLFQLFDRLERVPSPNHANAQTDAGKLKIETYQCEVFDLIFLSNQ